MLKIHIPNNFIAERKYILDTIFEDFLGLDYFTVITPNTDEYKIVLDNKKYIIIKDCFFSKFGENNYLSENNLPTKIIFSKNQFCYETDLPVIFGEDKTEVLPDGIITYLDVFASAFFMLTRWEEYVSKKRDKHNRFPDNESIIQKFNIQHRPIVNEYLEFIWKMIKSLEVKQERKPFRYSIKITHDIDAIAIYDKFVKYAKAAINDVIKRKSLILPFKTTKDYINIKNGTQKDYYDTFDFLMEQSESIGQKSHFYFMPGISGEKDVKYNITDVKVQNLIRNIIKRGHKIGLHATYNSFNQPLIFKTEKIRLENIYPQITEGRQHYLKFENPTTWQMWEDSNMFIDSTMSFSNDGGFKAGTCYAFNVFNILTKKKLKLIEQPLIAMDTAIQRKCKTPENVYNEFIKLKETTKKYNGNFVLLWHNSNFYVHQWKGYENTYIEIIKNL